jgi:hypothetical protein
MQLCINICVDEQMPIPQRRIDKACFGLVHFYDKNTGLPGLDF